LIIKALIGFCSMIKGIVPSAYRRPRSEGEKLGAMEDLLFLLSCIAPVLSQAPEQFVWPRLSEEDGGGPGKDPGQARIA
jgi:hypothetical protein